MQRIYDHTDEVAARHPEVEFIKAEYLNDHPLVLDCFADRVQEILDGENNMNCQLCKYREQFLGFEDQVGLVQESHHHHVEGIGTGAAEAPAGSGSGDPAHDGGHGHAHTQGGGHHHPYPHADHPLGPLSMKKE